MRRYRPYSRRELRSRWRTWLTRNWKLVALTACGIVVVIAVETAVTVWLLPDSQWKWYVLGALHTGIAAAVVHLLHSAFLAHDREAILHMRGAWGEENTRSELERAQRKRLIWGWVDSVNLEQGDIDHLVVTRAGGLVAIDSKWRNQTDAADRESMARAARKARLRAEGLVQTLLKREHGTHRARGATARVTPLLVLWGAAHHSIPEGAQVDGIDVVSGRRLIAWLKHMSDDPIDRDAARDVITRLEQFRASSWQSGGGSRSSV